MTEDRIAIVTGASGQDGYFLTRYLLAEGWTVHAVARDGAALNPLRTLAPDGNALCSHEVDITDANAITALLRHARPTEIYNLAGHSSVSASFADPAKTWRSNAEAVLILLEAVRREAPGARVYQSSSGEMFGWLPGESIVHAEDSPLLPQSPYAVAKAAAHLLCGSYRRAYGIRVACGILFNHESHRRTSAFLTRKVTDHVRRLRGLDPARLWGSPPLQMGNLAARRDWGYAPDYVEGIVSILRQISVRNDQLGRSSPADTAEHYRDYVLATGQLHAVWELVDRAFTLSGLDLEWEIGSSDVREWQACFRHSGSVAVVVDPDFLRPSDPLAISADPSRAVTELGWNPRRGLDAFLLDMLADG